MPLDRALNQADYIGQRYNDDRCIVVARDWSVTELGRFAEPAMLVLVSLSDGPKHGYAIMSDVEEFAASSIGPGTLYAVLARLEAGGLIEPLESDDRRRPYRLTAAGAAALADQLAEMSRFLRIGRMRLRGSTEGLDR
jgi:DNA-binding PadR family transcriptional regulator